MTGGDGVVIDANIFVRTWLLDPVLCLADEAFLTPHWSTEIIREAREALIATRLRQGADDIDRYLRAIARAYPEAAVPGWEPLVPSIALPDPDDRHVVAAAVASGSPVILTYNVDDFPETELSRHGVRAEHPDTFLSRLFDDEPDDVYAIIRRMVESKKRPPRDMDAQIAYLRRASCPGIASRLESHR